MSSDPRRRVLLVDDHPVVLAGLAALIDSAPDFQVVGEASSAQRALKLAKEAAPDVAVLDVSLPDMSGILLGRMISDECPSIRFLMLTFHEDRPCIQQALEAGARGYLLKRSASEFLLHGVRAVLSGGLYLDPSIAGRVLGENYSVGRRPSQQIRISVCRDLTKREADVLRLTAFGYTNKEIAGQLNVTVKSVETYKVRASDKLDIRTRSQIVRYAIRQGWLCDE